MISKKDKEKRIKTISMKLISPTFECIAMEKIEPLSPRATASGPKNWRYNEGKYQELMWWN